MLKKKKVGISQSFKNVKGIMNNLKSAWHGNYLDQCESTKTLSVWNLHLAYVLQGSKLS